ncbi:hypothetical protein CHUAL_011044 [Chamberlinius hualienensis]
MAGNDVAVIPVAVQLTSSDSQSQNNAGINPVSVMDEESRTSLARKCFHDAVGDFISFIKWSTFKECYRDAYEKDKKFIRGLYLLLVNELETKVLEEFNENVLSDDFISNLSRLDKISAEFHTNGSHTVEKSKIWRPSRIPEKDMKLHRVENNVAIQQSNINDEYKLGQLEHQLVIKATQLEEVAQSCEKLPYSVMAKISSETSKSQKRWGVSEVLKSTVMSSK